MVGTGTVVTFAVAPARHRAGEPRRRALGGAARRWEERIANGTAARHAHGLSEGLRETGNRAFDEYRGDALRKLEEEANEFRAFLERLRMARDRAEFDEYMKERRNRPATEGPQTPPQP